MRIVVKSLEDRPCWFKLLLVPVFCTPMHYSSLESFSNECHTYLTKRAMQERTLPTAARVNVPSSTQDILKCNAMETIEKALN